MVKPKEKEKPKVGLFTLSFFVGLRHILFT